MISIPRFLARFLAAFAVLIVAGSLVGVPRFYAAAVERASVVVSPAVNGWWFDARQGTSGRELWLRRGERELRFQLSLEKLALGLYPLLSLLAATPGLGWKHGLLSAGIGTLAFFALDLVLVLLYPALVEPGAVPDIAGNFVGLITFVGGPVILWFVLTFDQLRDVWKLGPSGKGQKG